LGDPGLIEDAELAVGLLTDDRIAQDTRFDVLSGGAGSLLSMLPLVACGSAGARGRAIACGDHLLACRIESSFGERCWATFEDRPISGMAHGNSGIALALLRLGDATGDGRYRDAGLEAIAFENRTYSREADNWPDLRWRDTSYAAGWCHGAPGMAFARLEALGISGGDAGALALRRDVDAGARAAGRAKGGGADHLCCGNMGRALVQHEIGLATHNDAITEQAWGTAADIIRRAAGKYRFAHHYSGYLSFPGLFQGSAGVAYALLRMARPKTSPDFISVR
jgi:lantibiotic modifying enzyme